MDRQFSRAVDSQLCDTKGDGFRRVFPASKGNRGEVPPELNFAISAENRNGKKPIVHALFRGNGIIHSKIGAIGDGEHQGRKGEIGSSIPRQKMNETTAFVR